MGEEGPIGSGGHGAPARFTCRLKKITVSNPPWGPPPGIYCSWDVAPLYLTHILRLDRYEMISFKAQVGMLRSAKIVTMMLWSIRLNALLKSTKQASTAVGLLGSVSSFLAIKSSNRTR